MNPGRTVTRWWWWWVVVVVVVVVVAAAVLQPTCGACMQVLLALGLGP